MAPQSEDVSIEKGGDDFIETPKAIKKVEAEPRPDFKELKSIEKQRREILLRVSCVKLKYCVASLLSSSHQQN